MAMKAECKSFMCGLLNNLPLIVTYLQIKYTDTDTCRQFSPNINTWGNAWWSALLQSSSCFVKASKFH